MSERQIYTSGGSKVLAVPPDWANRIGQLYGNKAVIRRYGDLLLISPAGEYWKHRIITFDVKDHNYMVQRLRSSYLVGAEEVVLNVSSNDRSINNRLRSLQRELYGIDFRSQSSTEILVTFKQDPLGIEELLDLEFNLYQTMQRQNLNELRKFPNIDDNLAEMIINYETDLNATSFRAKRALSRAMYDPELFLTLGLEHPADITPYEKVENNLERLGDLQKNIASEIAKLRQTSHNLTSLSLEDLIRSYDDAINLVVKAFRERSDLQEIISVIYLKNVSEESKYVNWYDKLALDILKQIQPRKSDKNKIQAISRTLRSLGKIESMITGMRGNATNISEAWACTLMRKAPQTVEHRSHSTKITT